MVERLAPTSLLTVSTFHRLQVLHMEDHHRGVVELIECDGDKSFVAGYVARLRVVLPSVGEGEPFRADNLLIDSVHEVLRTLGRPHAGAPLSTDPQIHGGLDNRELGGAHPFSDMFRFGPTAEDTIPRGFVSAGDRDLTVGGKQLAHWVSLA